VIPTAIVLLYLGVVLYIGIFAFRRAHAGEAEDFFLAGRSLGPAVFLLSLFGTHMTAFAILGSSGHAFANGIVTYGLMASSSALVVPLGLFLVGTRIWAVGKRFGFITPVQIFRDRWETSHVGTVIFAVQAALLVPYIIIGVKGGGATLAAVSGGAVPYWLGGAIVALVVMSYVFFGGMRGTAWVNTLQTSMFLLFGAVAILVVSRGVGGFSAGMEALLADARTAPLLTRERASPLYFLSYTLIPLSSIAFPHIAIFCLTARHMRQFKRTVVLYPLCLLVLWLPCVLLGVMAHRFADDPKIADKLQARAELAQGGAALAPEARAELQRRAQADDVMLVMLERTAPVWLVGLLGAGIMAAVMASDSQILALSTMFTEDVFAHYGGKERFGEAVQVATGRAFVVALTLVAYAIAVAVPASIFDLAVQYAFSGFAALAPLMFAAFFWKGSTKWGALAATLWAAATTLGVAIFQSVVPAPTGPPVVVWRAFDLDLVARTAGGTSILGLLPVVPMVLGSCLLLWLVSALTPKPSEATIARYFPGNR
jgi:SSS family solute:Na+ symporter